MRCCIRDGVGRAYEIERVGMIVLLSAGRMALDWRSANRERGLHRTLRLIPFDLRRDSMWRGPLIMTQQHSCAASLFPHFMSGYRIPTKFDVVALIFMYSDGALHWYQLWVSTNEVTIPCGTTLGQQKW